MDRREVALILEELCIWAYFELVFDWLFEILLDRLLERLLENLFDMPSM